jgi:hypothetical protein
MNDPPWLSAVLHLLSAIIWPIAVLVLAFLFRGSIQDLIGRVHTLKASSTGLELLLSRAEKEGFVSSRAELSGLSSYDIWALQSFAEKIILPEVNRLNPAQRVAARTLLDLKLLVLVGEGANRRVNVAPLGSQILEAARSLPL